MEAQISLRRPFSDEYLLAYSGEHIFYEFEMFLWLTTVCAGGRSLTAPTGTDFKLLNNVLVEAFAVHLRNVIDFLYLSNPQSTDIVAADFFLEDWKAVRPPITATLKAAKIRANKEIAHLTTSRITGTPPEKGWDFKGLAVELCPIMTIMVTRAEPARLSQQVKALLLGKGIRGR